MVELNASRLDGSVRHLKEYFGLGNGGGSGVLGCMSGSYGWQVLNSLVLHY